MMKTKIVLCCDRCEKVFGEDEKDVYGILDTNLKIDSGECEVYICENCFQKIVDELVLKILNEAIKNHEFYIGLGVSKLIASYSYKINNHNIYFGELYSMRKNKFFPCKDHSYFVFKTYSNSLIPFYISMDNKQYDVENIKEILTVELKSSFYHSFLSTTRKYLSEERNKLQKDLRASTAKSCSISGIGDPNVQLFG